MWFQKHLDLETLHLISTLGWANHLAFQGKLDIRNPRIEQLRYKVKNPVAKKLKTMDSFSQPFAGCEPQRPFKRLCGFCVDYVSLSLYSGYVDIYNDLYIKCHFTKPEALEADPPHGPKMTWQWQMPQAFLVQRVRAMRWNGSYSPIDSWQLLGRVSAGPGCWRVLVRLWLLWIPEVFC